MAKRRDKKSEAEAPKFDGFRQLAGLKEFKDKLKAESGAEASAGHAGAAKGARQQAPSPVRETKDSRAESATSGRREREGGRARDADDELTFHRMMAGVTPLGSERARVPVTSEVKRTNAKERAAEAEAKTRAEASAVLEHLHHLVDDVARFEVTDDGRRVEGRRVDTPPSVLRTLRRGLLPIDARLDLHGLTAPEARDKLLGFLRDTRGRGERCVLVIHGKGERVAGSGVLRGEIGAWLSQGRAREHVAAFATATSDDGGEGAVYVALRR